jgi:hypothetical protein
MGVAAPMQFPGRPQAPPPQPSGQQPLPGQQPSAAPSAEATPPTDPQQQRVWFSKLSPTQQRAYYWRQKAGIR